MTKTKAKKPSKYTTEAPLLALTPEQENTVLRAMETFTGNAATLSAALGALILGRHFGWRVLRMVHSPSTYTKYEKILGIEFKDVCPERGPLANKSKGLVIADKLQSFWAVVMGRHKVDNKGLLSNDAPEDVKEGKDDGQ